MNTATSPFTRLAPTISYHTRDYAYERHSGHDLADGTLTLQVQRGRKTVSNTYALQCERAESGFLAVVYLAKAFSEDGEVYGVEMSLDGRSRCSCTGFARHGNCKHNDAIRDLIAKGQLDEVHPDEIDTETMRDVGEEIEAMSATSSSSATRRGACPSRVRASPTSRWKYRSQRGRTASASPAWRRPSQRVTASSVDMGVRHSIGG